MNSCYALLMIQLLLCAPQGDSKPIPFLAPLRSLDESSIRAEAKKHDVNNTFLQGMGAFHMFAMAFKVEPGKPELSSKDAKRIADILLKLGAKPNDLDDQTETPLHTAASYGTCDSVVKAMIDAGADPNIRQTKGPWHAATPLFLAIERKSTRLAGVLLENGADPQMRGNRGNAFPLSVAAWRGELSMVKLLVAHGAKVNAAKEDGQTALHAAVLTNRKENADVVRFLLSKKADKNARTKAGESALDIAKRKKFDLIIHALGN